MAELQPGGFYSGYLTMAEGMGGVNERAARLQQFLQNAPLDNERKQAELEAQKFQNQNAMTMMQAKMQGSPFEQLKHADELALKKQELEKQYALLNNTLRHQTVTEKAAADRLAMDSKRFDPINMGNQKLLAHGVQLAPGPNGEMQVVPIEGANANKPVPIAASNNLTSGADMLQKMVALRNEFKPDYAGWVVPGVGETVNALEYLPMVPTAQRDWWKNYEDLYQATKRHNLYGAGLSGREIGLSKGAAINPAMQSDSVEKYMDARIGMMLTDMSRNTKQLSQSFNPKQIEAATGIEGIKDAQLSPKTIDDFAAIGKTYRSSGKIGGSSSWLERAIEANPSVSKEEIIKQGKRLGKI